MPQKRNSNAAKARGTAAGSSRPVSSARAAAQNDIAGVALAILAVALLVSLVSPSGAIVTHAVERGLTMCFGVGAILCPITVFLFALTFFVEGEEPFGTRAAFGLVLVSAAVLALISLFYPGADADPSLVLDPILLQDAGGYVGGGVAWVLLSLVGKWVGLVLLVGLAVLGVIVCGFSVSGFVVRMREGAVHLGEIRTSAREQRAAMREESQRKAQMRAAARPEPQPKAKPERERAPHKEDATSFIGSRTTSVLTRHKQRTRPPAAQDELPWDEPQGSADDAPVMTTQAQDEPLQVSTSSELAPTQQEAKTTARLTRKKAKKSPRTQAQDKASKVQAPKPKEAKPRKANALSGQASDQSELVVPDFLRNPKAMAPMDKAQDEAPARKAHAKVQSARPGEGMEGYELPPLAMLSSNPNSAGSASSREELEETKRRLQGTIREFGLTSRVVDYVSGPIVTTFRVEMGEGERVSRIRNLEDDIALTLAAEKVRIFAPIPGTSFVGIEIPNKTRQNVHLGDVLPFASGGPLEVAIGRDSSGSPVVADIAKMPHMLVAGTTGSGKSVMINSMIMSLLMRTTPKQVRLIMIDPKRVEFSCYNGLPHLYVPVVTEPRQAASALQWAVSEMERRLKVFERAGAREINVYNRMCVSGKLAEMDNPPEPMPYLVVIIDELSDLMMVAGKDVEASIVRIAQLARAAGIHLVIATQRPSANVVTGLIKSNIDNRVALKVSSGIDSRVILDETGAERLLGNGDMLFKYRGLNMQRVLGCYTSDNEINAVVDFIREQAEPDYHEEILSAVVPGQPIGGGGSTAEDDDDPLVWEAAQIVVESRLGSTSGLQRRLKVGYARAGRIMDMLEAKGVVGPPDGSKPREVLLDEDGLEELRVQDAKYREVV